MRKTCQVLLIALIISLKYVERFSSTDCSILRNAIPSKSDWELSVTLKLSASDVNISSAIIDYCPKNITDLYVTSDSENSTYVISTHSFRSNLLDFIRNVFIKVKRLKLSSEFNHDFRSNLRKLVLRDCGINELPALGTFYGFSRLLSIDISHNALRELPIDLVMYSPSLKMVDLSHNMLKTVPYLKEANSSNLQIDISSNALDCSCTNAWVISKVNFVGFNCPGLSQPCPPYSTLVTNSSEPSIKLSGDTLHITAFTGSVVSFACHVSSRIPTELFWFSPIGVIPVTNSTITYSYIVQPILERTSISSVRTSESGFNLRIRNARGHLSGVWYCIAHSSVDLTVSSPIYLHVYSGMYYMQVYVISLYYGFGAMAVLLLVGIIGGTIRYCHETHCLRRPQPPFSYGGKTFIGVIPVPEVGESIDEKVNVVSETFGVNNSLQYLIAERRCNICNNPPSYWFCDHCKAIHFVDSVYQRLDHPEIAPENLPYGLLSSDGEVKLMTPDKLPSKKIDSPISFAAEAPSICVEVRDCLLPLMNTEPSCTESELNVNESPKGKMGTPSKFFMSDIYLRSGDCVVQLLYEGVRSDSLNILDKLCCHYPPRSKGANVKLIVSNEKLAEEYRIALDGLARAVESPDPAHFRERLEEFRSRLRRDVGHGVKVLRGEFQDLRAKSARGVATLRNQSSAAAQRMRAGLSHGMEQMKDGMRSVAELCGASGTIGQTISVVSIYKDEIDHTKKERLVSDFVF